MGSIPTLPAKPPRPSSFRKLDAFEKANNSLTHEERQDFASFFIGSLAADSTGVTPKTWDYAIDMALSLVQARRERVQAPATPAALDQAIAAQRAGMP